MLPYLLPVVCSQRGSQCNLFIMEVPSLPGAPSNANWKSQSLQPLSHHSRLLHCSPWPFHYPLQATRTCPCCGPRAPSSFFLEPASRSAAGRPPSAVGRGTTEQGWAPLTESLLFSSTAAFAPSAQGGARWPWGQGWGSFSGSIWLPFRRQRTEASSVLRSWRGPG